MRFHTITCHAKKDPVWSSQAHQLKVPGELEQLGGDLDDIQVTRQKCLRTASIDPSCTSGWYSKITSTPWIMISYWGQTPGAYQYTQYTVFWWTYWIYATLRDARKKQTNQRTNHVELESLMFHPAQAIVAIQQVLLQMFEWFLGVEFLRCSFCLVYFLSICFSNCLMSIMFNLPSCFWVFFCGDQVISKLGT